MDKVGTCLWLDGTGLRAAARFHVSLIPGSEIEGSLDDADRKDAHGTPPIVNFRLGETP